MFKGNSKALTMLKAAERLSKMGVTVYSNYPMMGKPLPDFEGMKNEVTSTKLDYRIQRILDGK